MRLSREEEEMMSGVRSKMRYAGESYHRVAPAEVEVNLLKGKRKRPDVVVPEESEGEDDYNTIERERSGKNKYQKIEKVEVEE